MNFNYFIILLLIILFIIIIYSNKTENFTQGYNYLISNCIRQCILDYNNKDPYFNAYEDDGFFATEYCENKCKNRYNKIPKYNH